MDKELIAPAAQLALGMLKSYPQTKGQEWSAEVIASAFEAAYAGLEAGIERVKLKKPRGKVMANSLRF
ncbi:MAG: hypothetical protein EON92_00405 [Burkholderiales bacterium]|nr:MAG: hypothetical protein EON92_00405 [Burkholderiales bacterium]